MGINFARGWFLLLLIPAILLLLVYNGKKRYLPRSRALTLGIRGLMMLLLILALAQPHLSVSVPGTSIVYLVDQSRSLPESDHWAWVGESLATLPERDRASVVAFGRDTQLYKPFSMTELPSAEVEIDPQFTDIESAMETGYGLLPASGGKLVLLSDGLGNSGDSLALADILAAAGIAVDVLPLASQQGEDVAIQDISLPKNTWPDQEVVVEVMVESTLATPAQLNLFWGGSMVASTQVELSPGSQAFSLPVTVKGQSLQRVRATIEPAIDAEIRNNSMDGLTFVQAPPRVLVVEGEPGKGGALVLALSDAGIQVETISVEAAQLSPAALASYRAVFLADVPAYQLDETQLATLDSFVRVLGGGLVAVGGRRSFGMGLYQDTVLEEMLPVAMRVDRKSV